jgi:hypothetical protein
MELFVAFVPVVAIDIELKEFKLPKLTELTKQKMTGGIGATDIKEEQKILVLRSIRQKAMRWVATTLLRTMLLHRRHRLDTMELKAQQLVAQRVGDSR